jgi:N-acetylglucosaminyl-diphospho-decaprenol L-rhamnosyltransferase
VLTIAIINYQTPDLTAACVASAQASPPSEPFEIIVVDNGSSETTLAPLRRLEGARLVETGHNGGFAAGVNRCVAEADPASDVIAVLNSDTEVLPGALDDLARAVRTDGVGMAAPVILYPDRSVQRSAHRRFPTLWTIWMAICIPLVYAQFLLERWVRHPSSLSVAEHEAGVTPMHVMGAVLVLRRAAFEQVGPFDERYFMYFEETEWQHRLHDAGWRIALVPSARILHLHRGGAATVGVPPLMYLDSARIYFVSRGRRDIAVRAALASSLLVSAVSLWLYRPFTRWVPAHRGIVAASLPAAWQGFLHAARGRTLRRPGTR